MTLLRHARQLPTLAGEFARELVLAAARSTNSDLGRFARATLFHTRAHIDTDVRITHPRQFSAPAGAAVFHGTYILNTRGTVTLGRRSHLGAGCYVNASRGRLILGDDVVVGPKCVFVCNSNHFEYAKAVSETYKTGDIVIGNNVFLGAACTVLPNTIIEDNVVVAAGAVVRGTLASNRIYGGVPCKELSEGWYE